ncbi:Cell division control protein 6-like [Homarus americanus]|uniref:Cell division control protein 6-like n=1 Tax=Homarus americanus TaxID=6706 RepID=A0A8J5JYR9_HOMAM|nr:Cell division control protein 6-like [Homarus americanus]
MPGKQEAISFPIRKTRCSGTKSESVISTDSSHLSVKSCYIKLDVTDNVLISPSKTGPQNRLKDVHSGPWRSSRKTETSAKIADTCDSPRRSSRLVGTPLKPANTCSSPPRDTTTQTTDRYHSPERSSRRSEISPNLTDVCGNPRRTSRRSVTPVRRGESKTPSKRRSDLPDVDGGQSPTKRSVMQKLVLETTKLTPSKARRKLMSDDVNGENSPSPLTPRKTQQNVPLSPVRFSSPTRSSGSIEPRIPRMQTPQKSPLSSSNITNRGTFHSPARSTVKRLDLSSPMKSPLRRLDMNSPLNSPLKSLDVDGPRRSPRKLNQENFPSPRRSPRKFAQSPMYVSSPSSLVSRLSLASPTSTKKDIAVGLFKPDVTAYRSVRQCLNTGTPTVLLCREKQICDMQEFLTHHLTKAKPGSLYVSGAPGTGKTASLNSILDSLEVKKIKRVFLNCMRLKTSGTIYKTIVLIMLDEVDQLDSKHQEVLYTIFEWPALAGSSLVLVGIANSLDLTDRILPRLQARPTFKPKLLHFPPYTKAEIIKIINHRIQEAGLGDVQVIRPTAIQFLAGKVASVAGDVRKALDVCRRAVELCEVKARRQAVLTPTRGSPRKSPSKRPETPRMKMVEIPQVLSIFNEVYGSRVISAVTDAPESFPLQQKVLICCLLLILKHAKSKDVTLGMFHEVYTRVCRKRQMPGMDQSEFLSVCTLLESRGMLQVKRAKELRSSKINLRLNAEEAEQTLGDRTLLASTLDDRESLGKLCKAASRKLN